MEYSGSKVTMGDMHLALSDLQCVTDVLMPPSFGDASNVVSLVARYMPDGVPRLGMTTRART